MAESVLDRVARAGGGAAPPDEELVARVAAGETELFELLMRRHNGRVYRSLRSILRDEAEVEDAMQQAYLSAFSHLRDFAGEASFATWLTRIAIHEGLGRLRRRHRLEVVHDEAALEDAMDDGREPGPTPEDTAASSEAMRLLERAVDRLPTSYRTAFVLREIEGLTTAEAAASLGVSEDALKVRLHRARAALRVALEEEVGRGARDAFPFFAPRCDRVVRGVMEALRRGGAGGGAP